MTDKRKAMVEEILDFVNYYRENFGVRPTQQEVDDFLYSWQRKSKRGTGNYSKTT